jgi:hypothetical protein
MIDIRDRKKPMLVQKFQYMSESGRDITMMDDNVALFGVNQGTRYLPMYPNVFVHTEFYDMTEMTFLDNKKETLKIGATVQVRFSPIFQPQMAQIVAIYYYQNF